MDEKIKLLIRKRRTSNLEILEYIRKIVEAYPELRFTQILTILELDKDKFNEESVITLKHVKQIATRNLNV